MKRIELVILALGASRLAAACSSSPPPDTKTIDIGTLSSTGLLTSLTSTQIVALCNAIAAGQGGYGASIKASCEAGSVDASAPASQEACVQGFAAIAPDCIATVGDETTCQTPPVLQEVLCARGSLPAPCSRLAGCGLPM